MMLTGNKDVDRKILNELEDKDLVKACQVNKQADEICNDQVFWMNRVFNKFDNYVGGDVLRKYKGDRSWSEYYIHDLRKINKSNANKYLLGEAAKLGDVKLVNHFIKQGANNWDSGMIGSARGGHKDLVEYFIEKRTGAWVSSLMEASAEGHKNIVEYLINNDPYEEIHDDDLNDAMVYAHVNGYKKLVRYLISKGAWATHRLV